MTGPVKLVIPIGITLAILLAWSNRDRAYRWMVDGAPPTELLFTAATKPEPRELERALALIPVDTRDEIGATALCLASHAGDARAVERLLAAGAEINARTPSGWTPLLFAIYGRQPQTVQLLLARGADPTCQTASGLSAHGFSEIFNVPECAAVLPPEPAIEYGRFDLD